MNKSELGGHFNHPAYTDTRGATAAYGRYWILTEKIGPESRSWFSKHKNLNLNSGFLKLYTEKGVLGGFTNRWFYVI